MPRFTSVLRRPWLGGRRRRAVCRTVCALVLATAAAHGLAGGGPENVFVVVNPSSADSLAVANAFVACRDVPPINIFMLPWKGGGESTSIEVFRREIIAPIIRAIDARRLSGQIDSIAYSSDFPVRVDVTAELSPELAKRDTFPSAALTGLTMLYGALQGGPVSWLDPESNDYYRLPAANGVPDTTLGFRGWYGWGQRGELLEAGGTRYLLAVMLGVTSGKANSVREVAAYLRSSAAADGTRPTGTVYLMNNSDIRSTTRSGAFAATAKALESLGVKAEIVSGTLPSRKKDVAGLTTGTASFDWRASGSTILPGAIYENLTSFGAVFSGSTGQTPLTEFLRAGAAGSSGTVIEPFSIQAKFPHPAIHVHYARGASLAEAFYQSVRSPYQLLVVGDPLCQPWAVIPQVEVVTAPDSQVLEPGARLSGKVELEPRASMPEGRSADRFELFVDGMRFTSCGAGQWLTLDTRGMADGHHELRVVAIDASPLETQGRRVIPVTFDNAGRTLELSVEPRRVRPGGTLRVAVKGVGIEGAVVFATGRVLGRTSGAEATVEVPADLLGRGRVAIRASGRAGPQPADSVTADPVFVEVLD